MRERYDQEDIEDENATVHDMLEALRKVYGRLAPEEEQQWCVLARYWHRIMTRVLQERWPDLRDEFIADGMEEPAAKRRAIEEAGHVAMAQADAWLVMALPWMSAEPHWTDTFPG